MTKRLLTLILTTAIVCNMFTACGNNTTSEHPSSNTNQSVNSTDRVSVGTDIWWSDEGEVYMSIDKNNFITSDGIYFGMYYNRLEPLLGDVSSIIYNGKEYNRYKSGEGIAIAEINTCLSDDYINFIEFSDFHLNNFSLDKCESLAINLSLYNLGFEIVGEYTVNLYPEDSWKVNTIED